MRMSDRLCRLEAAIPVVPTERAQAAFREMCVAVDMAANRKAAGIANDDDLALLSFLREGAHEAR